MGAYPSSLGSFRPGSTPIEEIVVTAERRESGFLDQDNLGFRLRTDFDITPAVQLSYIGGIAEMKRRNASDNDGGTNPGFKQEHRTEWSNFDSYSHELALKSIGESRFQWIAGAYLVHEDNSIRFDIDISQVPAPTSRGFQLGFYDPPRTVGVRMNVNF